MVEVLASPQHILYIYIDLSIYLYMYTRVLLKDCKMELKSLCFDVKFLWNPYFWQSFKGFIYLKGKLQNGREIFYSLVQMAAKDWTGPGWRKQHSASFTFLMYVYVPTAFPGSLTRSQIRSKAVETGAYTQCQALQAAALPSMLQCQPQNMLLPSVFLTFIICLGFILVSQKLITF